MKMVIFGLTISSSWGNGHATLWRGLTRALIKRGWRVTFFEHNTAYYAQTRDLHSIDGGELVLYDAWRDIIARAERDLREADVAIVTSYCPDGISAGELVTSSAGCIRVFYDLDTPITLAQLSQGRCASYIGPRGLARYDLVLSYTGGDALIALREKLGARVAVAFYGHADPSVHRPAPARSAFAGDLSYLGTYSPDRQQGLVRFFLDPARRRSDYRFVLGGAQYPPDFPWAANIFFVRHLPPQDHPAFFRSSRLTLNVTRRTMAAMGWCPSGRLFEAAACGTPIISDEWPGFSDFFEPGREILIAREPEDVLDGLNRSAADLAAMAHLARERLLAQHTSDHRAAELERLICKIPQALQPVAQD